jgi:hypothetical protein
VIHTAVSVHTSLQLCVCVHTVRNLLSGGIRVQLSCLYVCVHSVYDTVYTCVHAAVVNFVFAALLSAKSSISFVPNVIRGLGCLVATHIVQA